MDKNFESDTLERLLREKDFVQLDQEERDFVLQLLEDEQEYSSMRTILIDMDEIESPPPLPYNMKNELLELHNEKHRKGSFKVWLNSLFSGLSVKREDRRAVFQLAGLAAVAILAVFAIQNDDLDQNSAGIAEERTDIEHQPQPEVGRSETEDLDVETTNKTYELENARIEVVDAEQDIHMDLTDEAQEKIVEHFEESPMSNGEVSDAEVIENELVMDVNSAPIEVDIDIEGDMEETEELLVAEEFESFDFSDELSSNDQEEIMELEEVEVAAVTGSATVNAQSAKTRSFKKEYSTPNSLSISTDLISSLYTVW